jgi:CHAT domain-containing protein/tetratricopeptide (TPR) repeat protein
MSARLLTELGFAARNLNDLGKARALEDSALALERALGMRNNFARSLNALGLISRDANQNAEAAEFFEQSLAAAAAVADSEGVAKAIGNAGLAYDALGDHVRARRGYRTLRDAGRKLGNAVYEGNGLTNEASVDVAEGDARSALARLDTALALYERAGPARWTGEQTARVQRATAFELLGDYDRAFSALDTALALARQHSMVREEITALRLLGGLHRRIGDYRRALSYYERAESLARTSGIVSDLGTTLYGTAVSRAMIGDWGQAQTDAAEARRIHVASGERDEQLDDVLLLADLADARSDRTSAEHLLKAADSLVRAQPTRATLSQLALARARHADHAHNGHETLRALEGVDTQLRVMDFEIAWSAAALAARAYAALNRWDSSAVYGHQAVDALERMRGRLPLEPMRAALAAERADVYTDYIVSLLRLNRRAEAFAVADGARSRSLIDRLSATGDGLGNDAASLEGQRLLRRIGSLLDSLRDASPKHRPDGDRASAEKARSDVADALVMARRDYEALMIRAGLSRRTADSAVTLADVQRVLSDDELLLEYVVGPKTLFLFLVDRRSLRVVQTPVSATTLNERIGLLHDLWSAPKGEWHEGVTASEELRKQLLATLDEQPVGARPRRLIIIPHGLLAQIPFAALLDARTARFLVQDFIISYAPSAATLVRARRVPGSAVPRRRVAAFAPFVDELPGSADEVSNVVRLLPQARAYLKGSATEQVVRDALLSGSVVHVASHGVMSSRTPLFSRIELAAGSDSPSSANDGRLEVREVLGLKLSTPLVFLSGCETGAFDAWLAAPVRGTAELSLSESFLLAGASNVVSTLWRIDDSGAAQVAERFYQRLAKRDAASALAEVQRELIQTPSFSAPYYWASYRLSGNGQFKLGAQN